MRLRSQILTLFIGLQIPSVGPASTVEEPTHIVQWSNGALRGIRDAKLGAPVVARALAIVHTCMYDAWAAYDERAVGTQLAGALRRPASERTYSQQRASYQLCRVPRSDGRIGG